MRLKNVRGSPGSASSRAFLSALSATRAAELHYMSRNACRRRRRAILVKNGHTRINGINDILSLL